MDARDSALRAEEVSPNASASQLLGDAVEHGFAARLHFQPIATVGGLEEKDISSHQPEYSLDWGSHVLVKAVRKLDDDYRTRSGCTHEAARHDAAPFATQFPKHDVHEIEASTADLGRKALCSMYLENCRKIGVSLWGSWPGLRKSSLLAPRATARFRCGRLPRCRPEVRALLEAPRRRRRKTPDANAGALDLSLTVQGRGAHLAGHDSRSWIHGALGGA